MCATSGSIASTISADLGEISAEIFAEVDVARDGAAGGGMCGFDTWTEVSIGGFDTWTEVSIGDFDTWTEVSISDFDTWTEVSIGDFDTWTEVSIGADRGVTSRRSW